MTRGNAVPASPRLKLRRFLAATALACAVSQAAHASLYTVTDLGVLGTLHRGDFSEGFGLNASGRAAGTSTPFADPGAPHAFLSGVGATAMTDLGTLGGRSSHAFGINTSGQVVGSASTRGNTAIHAFISAPDGGALTDLGTLGGATSEARAVNDNGQVVGNALTANGTERAFISAPNGGALTDLGTLGGRSSQAFGINASGQVVGRADTRFNGITHAFISAPDGGALRDLGTLGGRESVAFAVNASGQVVGRSDTQVQDGGAPHAFISAPNGGALTDLGALGGGVSEAFGINSRGEVVGDFQTSLAGVTAAFIYRDGVMEALNLDLDDIHIGPDGTTDSERYNLSVARAINDSGQILVDGFVRNSLHALLLTPVTVPLPPSVALLGLGVAGIIALGRADDRSTKD